MRKNLLYFGILACTVFLTACSKEELRDCDIDVATGEVLFYGAIKKQSDIQATTRAPKTPEPNDYMTLNETGDEFGTFYIWMDVEDKNNDIKSFFQPYVEAGAEQGNLVIDPNKQPGTDINARLNWYDETSDHTFYAWTQPSVYVDEEFTGGVKMDEFPVGYGEQNPKNKSVSGTVTFGIGKDTNLEEFIVARKGPVSYDKWGQDVALYFDRPVAKMTLVGVRYYRPDGSYSETEINNATIYFPNMYKSLRFHPLAEDVDRILTPETPADDCGLRWKWQKGSEDEDQYSLYVNPFKFEESVPDGKVGIENGIGYFIVQVDIEGKPKSYAGTLNSLILYDKDGKTQKELRASQWMYLYLEVHDGAGIGGGYTIKQWSDKDLGELPQYRIPGVYNKEDADRLLEALKKASETSTTYKFPDGVEDLLVDKTINLFSHVDWTGENITIPQGYTLSGNGYNVTLGDSGRISGTMTDIYIDNIKYEPASGASTDDNP